ncbi:TetR/AcrR family transcriptional regulator C-terminal domain-containing protein [Microbacterium sp.]|uniref:TetR/AcrR family transcriptional regulator C-terminal domain-containing protein n=1 Tax=Microbacterium sp. TaxID=51671 RepID=UPI003221CFF4
MPRPRTPLLSTDRIGDAAMELVDAGRPFGVNAVARHLGVTPSSLYHHVSGLDEIVELMRGRFAERYAPRMAEGDWDHAVAEALRVQRRMYGEHPLLVPLLSGKTVVDRRSLLWYEQIAAALVRGGFRDDELVIALSVIDAFAFGFGLDLASPAEAWTATDDVPVLSRALAAPLPPRGRRDEAFEWGLRMLLDGLRARLADRAG